MFSNWTIQMCCCLTKGCRFIFLPQIKNANISIDQKQTYWLWHQCKFTWFYYCREGYKLCIPLHKSVVTGRYQVSGLLFLATENRENVQTGLTFFKKSLPYSPKDLDVRFHYSVDKDFDYIEVSFSYIIWNIFFRSVFEGLLYCLPWMSSTLGCCSCGPLLPGQSIWR